MVKKVEYVGLKDSETDHLYGTGITWVGKGDIQPVPDDAWERMQVHRDVWKLADEQDEDKASADAGLKQKTEPPKPTKAWPLRDDGPTLDEFVAAGFDAADYPPPGHAVRVATPPAPSPIEPPAPTPAPVPAPTPAESQEQNKPTPAAVLLPTHEQAVKALDAMSDEDVIALGVEKGLGKNTQPHNMRRKLAVILSTPSGG